MCCVVDSDRHRQFKVRNSMADDPQRAQPNIPAQPPDVQPKRGGLEIPADKDAPQKDSPTKGER